MSLGCLDLVFKTSGIIYIINVSVARAEIACNKVLIDYGEALFHCKILKFNKKRGTLKMMASWPSVD